MIWRKRLKTAISLLLVCVLVGGCAGRQAPAPKTEPLGEEPTISLYINETGEKKNIKMEEYIQGVVAAEMDTKWPVNALAAQAILARTFAVENINSGRVKKLHGTDVSTSVEESQAYDPTKINDNVRQAVNMTRGKIITVNNNPIHAWFSACCGGISASAPEGLAYTKEATPYIKAGAQDGCLEITEPKNKAWEARIPLGQVRAAVQSSTGKDPGAIKSVAIQKKGPSGRAEQIKIGKVTISGPALRLALGSEKVRSMLLTDLRIEGDQLVLRGKGFGHGVGMCQWGAKLMAEQGKSCEEIIKFYFQDVDLQQKWQ